MALIPPLGLPLLWPLAILLLQRMVCLLSPVMCICCPSVTLLHIASSSFRTDLVISIVQLPWRQLSLFSLDRPGIDLSWKIAHGVLYTAARLFSFGLNYGVSCFCRLAPETSEHLFFFFFSCPLAQSVLSWLQSLNVSVFSSLSYSFLSSCVIWL